MNPLLQQEVPVSFSQLCSSKIVPCGVSSREISPLQDSIHRIWQVNNIKLFLWTKCLDTSCFLDQWLFPKYQHLNQDLRHCSPAIANVEVSVSGKPTPFYNLQYIGCFFSNHVVFLIQCFDMVWPLVRHQRLTSAQGACFHPSLALWQPVLPLMLLPFKRWAHWRRERRFYGHG